MDLEKLLNESIRLDRQIGIKHHLQWRQEIKTQNTFLALDVELSEMANTSEWFKVWKTHRGKQDAGKTAKETLLYEYVDALDFFLLVANLKKWNRVVLKVNEQLATISELKAAGSFEELNKQYLIMKRMLLDSYFNRREASFEHCFKLFLKFGLVEFNFTEAEIEAAFFDKNNINYERQDNNY